MEDLPVAPPAARPPLARRLLPLQAVGAVTVQLVAVSQQAEAIALHDVLLRLLDHRALELHDLPAARAHQMVVVLVLDLEAGDTVVEVAFARETGLAEQLHRAIHGRIADVRILLADALVELLARDVPLHAEEDLEDGLTLTRVLEIVALEIAGERLVLEVVRHGVTVSDACGPINRDAQRPAVALRRRAARRFSTAARLSQSSSTARSNAASASASRPAAAYAMPRWFCTSDASGTSTAARSSSATASVPSPRSSARVPASK